MLHDLVQKSIVKESTAKYMFQEKWFDPEKQISDIVEAVRNVLWGNMELLSARYKTLRTSKSHPLMGHCYVACEVVQHFAKTSGIKLQPKYVKIENITHWFLVEEEDRRIVDPTYDQFDDTDIIVPYNKGRGCGFLTAKPSQRAQKTISLVQLKYPGVLIYGLLGQHLSQIPSGAQTGSSGTVFMQSGNTNPGCITDGNG